MTRAPVGVAIRSRCSIDSHEALKAHPARFADSSTTFVGLQPDGEGGLLELRNCNACGSTLTRPLVGKASDDELRLLAERYAAHCRLGEVLQSDDRYYWPFAAWIPGALARRHMHLEHAPGGWLVCSARPLTLVP